MLSVSFIILILRSNENNACTFELIISAITNIVSLFIPLILNFFIILIILLILPVRVRVWVSSSCSGGNSRVIVRG